MRSASVLLPLLAIVAACQDQPAPTKPAASAHPAATVTASAATGAATAPKPKPLAVATLTKALQCKPKSDGPCAVLADFHDCQAVRSLARSADARWLGLGYRVKSGAFVEQYTLLRSRRVPLDQVAPGQLGVKLAIDRIGDDQPTVLTNAGKAVRAYQRSDVPKKLNAAVKYVKERSDWTEAYAMQSEGNQVYVGSGGGAYLCGMADQRLLLVKRANASAHAGDGLYAVLWPVSW